MSSFLDKYRIGNPEYLVYYEKGEIKVAKGYCINNKTFVLADKHSWMTTAPSEYMVVGKRGRVLVKNEEDIPKAKQMIYEYYIGKMNEVEDQAKRRLYNIQNMIEQSVKEGVIK